MSKLLKIAVLLSATDKMSAVVNKAMTNAEKRAKSLKNASQSISDVSDKAMIVGAAGTGMFVGAIKAAADMERMNVALKTSFQGNEKAANDAFNTINKFAATTPYELGEVMTGFIKLKNMGLDPSIDALTAYGNTASAMGKSLNDMVEAVADAATGEFERLKEFGIKASSNGDKVSFMFQGVKTTVAKNSAEIEKYLKKIGLTKFAGGIEAQSKTVYGQLSTLQDNFKMTAASVGKLFIPKLNELITKAGPIIDKLQKWIDKHPTLIKYVGAASVGLLALGAVGKVVAFTMSGVSSAITFTSTAMKFMGTTMKFVGRIFLTNPIGLIITAIAIAAYLIISNWDKIKAFFIKLWANVKAIFSGVWEWIKGMFLKYHPLGLIMKHWDKIKAFFSGLWTKVKEIFMGHVRWVMNLGATFYNAGKNIIVSIWNGIKNFVSKPVDAIKGMVKKIRNLLPFSPAKEGPLKDIHRIKLVETIASSINAKPLLNAMKGVTGQLYGQLNRPVPAMAGVGGMGGGMNVQMTFHINGNMTQQDASRLGSDMRKELDKWWKEKQHQQMRVGYNS